MRVCIQGLGYIGLPTAAVLAAHSYDVHGVDVRQEAVDIINAGGIHIVEPELDKAVHNAVSSGRFKAHTQPTKADVFIIAVPTPFVIENGTYSADMSYVRQAAETLCDYLEPGNMVILESTSPIGATRRDVAEVIFAKRPDMRDQLRIAHCPERVLPGHVLRELVENDRVVGGIDATSTREAAAFYRTFVKGEILETDANTAEMVKLTENSFRDLNIAFANELSTVCDRLNINVWELIRLANHHPRVNILNPGPGVGGHCLAVDPWFIVAAAPEEARLIRTAREVNDNKPRWVLEKIRQAAAANSNQTIGLLGLTYKADVDDLRESPSMTIAQALQKQVDSGEIKAQVVVCEPYLKAEQSPFDMASLDDTLARADILVMLTDHKEFKAIPADVLADKHVIDTRGVFSG